MAITLLIAEHSSVSAALIPVGDYVGGGTQGNFSRATGFEFTVNQSILVTDIGVYDHGTDGFASPHDVGLFLKSNPGVWLASATLDAGTSGTFVSGTVDGTRFLSLPAPLLLTAGTSYYMLANNFQTDTYAYGTGAVTYNPAITWDGFVDGTTNSITSAPLFLGGLPGNLGPNFGFVPEPATVCLLGLGGLALIRRRRG